MMRNWINLIEGKLSSYAEALLARIPEQGEMVVDIDGSTRSVIDSLVNAGLINSRVNARTFQATLSRKAPVATVVNKPNTVLISRLSVEIKTDILDMCLGPNGPKEFEKFWMDQYGVMSFNETYLSQFLFGNENLNVMDDDDDDDGAISVDLFSLDPHELDNSRRSVSKMVVGQYTKLKTKAPPILVRNNRGWKLVEGGHRLAAAKARGDAMIDVVDVSKFFTLTMQDWSTL